MPGRKSGARATTLEQMQLLLCESHQLVKRTADVIRQMQSLAIDIDSEAIRRAAWTARKPGRR